MSDKPKIPRQVALEVARELCRAINDSCAGAEPGKRSPFLKVCGSLRRGRQEVGDIELVYVPVVTEVDEPADLLGATGGMVAVNQVDLAVNRLIGQGVLAKRRNKLERTSWGEWNKYAVHAPTGMPVDLFATTLKAWWSCVVCRTGSAESNTRIASTALSRGWHWHPLDGHFTDVVGRRHWIRREEDAFTLIGLSYLQPPAR